MLRRQIYTNERVRRMHLENRQKEYKDEDSLKLVKRDKLIAANMASEERVENKRYGRHAGFLRCLLLHGNAVTAAAMLENIPHRRNTFYPTKKWLLSSWH